MGLAKEGGEKAEEWDKDKFRSGEFRKSQRHFVSDTPIAGPFTPGQARKTAGHNTAGKFNTEAHNKFHSICLSILKSFVLCQVMQWKDKPVQDSKQSTILEYNNTFICFLVS